MNKHKISPILRSVTVFVVLCCIISIGFVACAPNDSAPSSPPTNQTVQTTPTNTPTTTPTETPTEPTPTECLHEHTTLVGQVEATCKTNGYTGNRTCEDCGVIVEEGSVIDGHHGNTTLVNIKEATCTEPGYTGDVKCTVCNEVLEQGIETKKVEHIPVTKNVKSATCTKEGYSGDSVCAKCDKVLATGTTTKAKGHHIVYIRVKSATCTQNGYTGDEYCDRCDKEFEKGTVVPATGHTPGKWITDTKATCARDGKKHQECSSCKASIQEEVIPAVDHQYIVKNATEATCTKDGYSGDTACKNCGLVSTKGKVIPATGHKEKVVNAKKPTCTENGYTGDTICEYCEQYIKKGEKIAAKGHQYGEWIVTKKPNGWETGSKYRECSVCGTKETETMPKTEKFPIVEEGDGYRLTITREWFENAWVYAAHLEFTDYTRFGTDCANGKYNNGYETTSHAATRLGAILAVNGCYSAPYLDYTVVRSGKIWNGANRNLWIPAVYSSYNGKLISAWETGGDPTVRGKNVRQLVDDGLVTDTFCFGPPGMTNGVITDTNTSGSRAQRTFIGTNGNAGDIWVCVSDGRYNDGESAGLTGNQCMRFLASKGCTFGVNLDGGGSTTMVYRGHVLNAAKGNERAVVDFVYFK